MINKYDVLLVNGEMRLIVLISEQNSNVILYVCNEELFDTIKHAHKAVKHGDMGRTFSNLPNVLRTSPIK